MDGFQRTYLRKAVEFKPNGRMWPKKGLERRVFAALQHVIPVLPPKTAQRPAMKPIADKETRWRKGLAGQVPHGMMPGNTVGLHRYSAAEPRSPSLAPPRSIRCWFFARSAAAASS